jgi:FAD:protein FMN transferase
MAPRVENLTSDPGEPGHHRGTTFAPRGAEVVRLAAHAMGTRFEVVLCGAEAAWLRAAGEEALHEITLFHDRLSRFDPASIVSRINRTATRGPMHIDHLTFDILSRCVRYALGTQGAFDITVGPLMSAWGFRGGQTDSTPSNGELAALRERVGPNILRLDPDTGTVRLLHPEAEIDLGGIGKGLAIDAAAVLLREAGVPGALIHGGTSTIFAIGKGPDGEPWRVSLPAEITRDDWAVFELRDEALSVSATWGRSRESGEVLYGHVLDPRSGRPLEGRGYSVIRTASACEADALSTALLVLGSSELVLHRYRPSFVRVEPAPASDSEPTLPQPGDLREVLGGSSGTISSNGSPPATPN